MASYPRGQRPARPFPYYTEVMTGFEYYLAIHLLQVGRTRDARKVVRDIRERYDGHKRNPFDEAECGHHYARAMASWGLIPACTGFHYSALTGTLTLNSANKKVRWPWSTGGAWGTLEIKPTRRNTEVVLTVLHGWLALRRINVGKSGQTVPPRTKTLAAGQSHRFKFALNS